MYSERTLIISGSEKGLDGVIGFLKTCGCVAVVSSGSEARRMIPHDDYDLILINTPLKDEFGHQLAVKLCESTCSGVILICKADLAEEMVNRTGDYGVCVVSKPMNKQELVKALRIGSAFRHRLLTMQKENNKLRAKLEEMRYVSRAKFLLISEQGMTEEAAHRYIEKSAMDTRRTRKEVSLDFISLTLCRKYGRRHLPDPERYSPFRSGSRPRRRSRCQHPDALPAERHDPPGKPGCTGT